jgi:hypothetical protein
LSKSVIAISSVSRPVYEREKPGGVPPGWCSGVLLEEADDYKDDGTPEAGSAHCVPVNYSLVFAGVDIGPANKLLFGVHSNHLLSGAVWN